jgi:hypothetical protein
MSTLVPDVFPAHHQQISIVAEQPAGTPATIPADALSTIAVVVVIMLLGFALSWAQKTLSTFWDMTRMLFRPIGVLVLLTLSIVVLIGALVVPAVGR